MSVCKIFVELTPSFQIVEKISRLDLQGEKLDDLDKKFLQWRDGLHNRDSMDFNRRKYEFETSNFCRILLDILITFLVRGTVDSACCRQPLIADTVIKDSRILQTNRTEFCLIKCAG